MGNKENFEEIFLEVIYYTSYKIIFVLDIRAFLLFYYVVP